MEPALPGWPFGVRSGEQAMKAVAHLAERLGAIDRRAEMGPALEALREPRSQRPHLADHPPLAAARGPIGARRGVAEPVGLAPLPTHEQVDVLEDEAGAVRVRHGP